MTKLLVALLVVFVIRPLSAQNPGDKPLEGYTPNRTHSNSLLDPGTPLRLIETIPLQGISAPVGLLTVEDSFLVLSRESPLTRFHCLTKRGEPRWDKLGAAVNPVFGNKIVIIGGSTDTSYLAVDATSGATLWDTANLGLDLGTVTGRSPLIAGDLALVYGEKMLAAVRLADGSPIWQFPGPGGPLLHTVPLSLWENRLYLADKDGTFYSLDVITGETIWQTRALRPDPYASFWVHTIIATSELVFVSSETELAALRTSDGQQVWSRPLQRYCTGLALYEPNLFAICGRVSQWNIAPLDIWIIEASTGTDSGGFSDDYWYPYGHGLSQVAFNPVVAGDAIWLLHTEYRDVRIYDFQGGKRSLRERGPMDISISPDRTYVLRWDGSITVYGHRKKASTRRTSR